MKILLILIGVLMFPAPAFATKICNSADGYSYTASEEDTVLASKVYKKCNTHIKNVLLMKASLEDHVWKYFRVNGDDVETVFETTVLEVIVMDNKDLDYVDLEDESLEKKFSYAKNKGYLDNNKYDSLKRKFIQKESVFTASSYCCENMQKLLDEAKININ